MYCKYCGAQLPDGTKFCTKCKEDILMKPKQTKGADFETLVNKYLSGEGTAKDEAFAALYEASYKAVFAHVQRYTRNEARTEDIVQNAYISALPKMGQLKNKSHFTAWMKAIAYNEYVQVYRKSCNNELQFSVVSDSEGNETTEEEFIADESIAMPEDVLASNELHTLLLNSINELAEGQRIVMKGFYFDGKSIQTLAEELGIPVNTVKTNLSRGRKNLANKASSYANAYGLKLVPVAIIPLMAILSKKDVLACEAEAVSQAAVYAGIKAKTASSSVDAASAKAKEYADKAKEYADKAKEAAKKAANSKEAQEAKSQIGKAAEAVKAGNVKGALKYPVVKGLLGIAAGLIVLGGLNSLRRSGNTTAPEAQNNVASTSTSSKGELSYDEIFDGVSMEFSGVERYCLANLIIANEDSVKTGTRKVNGREVKYFGRNTNYLDLSNGDTVTIEAQYYDPYQEKKIKLTKDFTVSGLYYKPKSIDELPESLIENMRAAATEEMNAVFAVHAEENVDKDEYSDDLGHIAWQVWNNPKMNIVGLAYGTDYDVSGDTDDHNGQRYDGTYAERYGDYTNCLYIVMEVSYDLVASGWQDHIEVRDDIHTYRGSYITDIYINDNGDYSVGSILGVNKDKKLELHPVYSGSFIETVDTTTNRSGSGLNMEVGGADSAERVRAWQTDRYGNSIFNDLELQDYFDNGSLSSKYKDK